MTRGKNQRQASARAVQTANLAVGARREAEQEMRRLSRVVVDRDREIAQLKSALAAVHEERTTPGTFTQADIARTESDARKQHVESVQRGFEYLQDRGVAVIPMDDLTGFCDAFDIAMRDVLGPYAQSRSQRRMTAKFTRLHDEAKRQGVI